MKKAIFLSLILAMLASSFNLWAIDVYLNIVKGQGRKVRIAVPAFVAEKGEDSEDFSQILSQIVQEDLRQSGYFRLVEPPEVIPPEIDLAEKFQELKMAGAEMMADGQLSLKGEKMVLKGRLYDLTNNRQITGRAYRGKKNDSRQIAHRFSDEIVYRFTGIKGIAHTRIVFVHQEGRNKELYLVDYDGYNLEKLTFDDSLGLFPAWSPDGKTLLYTTFKKGNPDLYLIDFASREARGLLTFQGLNMGAKFSPDGKEIILVMSKDGNPELYLYSLKKKKLKRLTYYRGVDSDPTWSPNGREIAFSSDRSGTPQIYIMDKEGGNLRRLTFKGGYNTSPDWSPRGDKIVYAGMKGGSFDIYTVGVHTRKAAKLTDSLFEGGDSEDPCWSPDGRYIVYTSTRGGKREIFIMRDGGTHNRKLVSLQGNCFSPAWSP